jgi:hypothetical protein
VLEDSFGTLIIAAVFLFAVLVVLAQTVRIVPQAQAGIVERLGRYSRTLDPAFTSCSRSSTASRSRSSTSASNSWRSRRIR